MNILAPILLVLTLMLAVPAGAATPPADVYDIPQIVKPAADWSRDGFAVNLLTRNPGMGELPRADFDGHVRLGWTSTGLIVHVAVHAADEHEAASPDLLYTGDSVELFVSTGWGSEQRYQLVISPGLASDQPLVREKLYDHRAAPVPVGDVITRVKTADGYAMDITLPWSSLGISAKSGLELGFNVYINHLDTSGGKSQLAWRSETRASADPAEVNRIRLADRPSEPVELLVNASYANFRRLEVAVESSQPLTGRALWAQVDGGSLAQGIIDVADPKQATFTFPMPAAGSTYNAVQVTIDKRRFALVALPDLAQERQQTFEWMDFVAWPFVFSEPTLPGLGYQSPNLAEDAIGKYTVHTTYYDKDYNVVKTASSYGRYGAVSVVTSIAGYTKTYYTTLFRIKHEQHWREVGYHFGMTLPASLGIDSDVIATHPSIISDALKSPFFYASYQRPDIATLLSGLSEIDKRDPDVNRFSPDRLDSNWWNGLKKKLGEPVDYKYIVHTPEDYDAGNVKKWPLIVFLHGSGDWAKLAEVIGTRGIQKMSAHDFVLVAPYCHPDEGWSPDLVLDTVNEIVAKYHIDTDRIYLTGLSMGGFGTYNTAMTYPDRFAAIAPLCGIGDLADIDRIKRIPTWIFHGEADNVVPPGPDHEMAAALEKLGAPVKATFYPGVGHDCWTPAYNDPALYAWLLAQRLGAAGR